MKNNIKVASLFSGIGGFEQGFKKSKMNYELVFASEIDKYATITFSYNFPINNMRGDIKSINPSGYTAQWHRHRRRFHRGRQIGSGSGLR